MRFDTLYLWYLGDPDRPRPVGVLQRVGDGKGVSLRYGEEWLKSGFPLSEDLPLRDVEHRPPGRLGAGGAIAVGAVDDARPDRWGERVIDFIDKPARKSLMEYLYLAGDDRHGALGVSTDADSYRPKPGSPLPRLEDIETVSQAIQKVLSREPVNDVEARVLNSGGSFGGAKPKALVMIEGEQWIVKFPNSETVDLPRVEHATMTLARRARINTAETVLLRAGWEHAVAVKRFDRAGEARIHTVSAGTALRAAAAPENLSLGYPALAQLLRRAGVASTAAADTEELFRRMVFNILMDNTDDHEKNHALLDMGPGGQGRYRLAPAYDVVPTTSGQGMQEFVCGSEGRESSLANAMSECALFGLSPESAAKQVMDVIEVVDGWQEHFRDHGVSDADIEFLAGSIDESPVGMEREAFEPASLPPSPAPRARRSGAFTR